jgi:hypothetical protein
MIWTCALCEKHEERLHAQVYLMRKSPGSIYSEFRKGNGKITSKWIQGKWVVGGRWVKWLRIMSSGGI